MRKTCKHVILMILAALWMLCMTAAADETSGDNSLYSLGLENGQCSPDFYYSTLEYDVTVPAGTEELLLSPITSDSNAQIIDISGTVLDENGKGTVYITVEAPNGAQVSYVLNVSSDGSAEDSTETETDAAAAAAAQEEKYQEEMRQQAESEEAARQLQELQTKADAADQLQSEYNTQTDKMNMLIKILYGLVGLAVLLLFFIINQSLRNKDLKDELKEAQTQADRNTEFARRSDNMRSDYYYAPTHNPQQNMGQPVMDSSANVQAAFGNASQMLQAQPGYGQVSAPAQELSKKEIKKMEKAAKKAEKEQKNAVDHVQQSMPTYYQQPVYQQPMQNAQQMAQDAQQDMQQAVQGAQQTAEPTLVQGTQEEPDVNVEMVDL